MSFPDGIESTSLVLEMDFRSGAPIGRYQTASMAEPAEHLVERKWIWDVEPETDVIEFCSKGLEVARALITSREAMQFRD